jgi:DNA-binding transcriptional regulator GbsR (MarR family)
VSKLPAIQFYPGDWRKDLGVQSLSYQDRGIWFEMLLLMHESEVRGKLLLGGKPMSEDTLAGILHLPKSTLSQTVETLIERGVTEREKRTGALINRRMLRDEILHAENRARLHKWRKTKKTQENGNVDDTADETQMKRLPSSSSSSSSSTSVSRVKQKPSRAKTARAAKAPAPSEKKATKTADADKRHADFKAATQRYWDSKNPGVQMPWDGREGKALGMFLRAAPDITLEQFTGFLRSRFKSEVNHGERASQWIAYVTSYAAGPMDRFGKTIGESNGASHEGRSGGRISPARERVDGNRRALAEALAARGVDGPWNTPRTDGAEVPEPRRERRAERIPD